jgi:hypothetical protein
MNEASSLAILAVMPTQATAVERMPVIVNHDFSLDMGRMAG